MPQAPTWDEQVKAAKAKPAVQADAGPTAEQALMQQQIGLLLRIERILSTTSRRVMSIEIMLGIWFLCWILGGIIGVMNALAPSGRPGP